MLLCSWGTSKPRLFDGSSAGRVLEHLTGTFIVSKCQPIVNPILPELLFGCILLYIGGDNVGHTIDSVTAVLREMWPENRLVIIVAALTDLSVRDAVAVRREQLQGDYLVVGAKKFWLPSAVRSALVRIAAEDGYIFTHRLKAGSHRTRQAVYKDMRRACRQLNCESITPNQVARTYKPL